MTKTVPWAVSLQVTVHTTLVAALALASITFMVFWHVPFAESTVTLRLTKMVDRNFCFPRTVSQNVMWWDRNF